MNNVQMVQVTCIDNGRTINAELLDVKPSLITVILPGFQKLTMHKDKSKAFLYTAKQFGMEFYTNYNPR